MKGLKQKFNLNLFNLNINLRLLKIHLRLNKSSGMEDLSEFFIVIFILMILSVFIFYVPNNKIYYSLSEHYYPVIHAYDFLNSKGIQQERYIHYKCYEIKMNTDLKDINTKYKNGFIVMKQDKYSNDVWYFVYCEYNTLQIPS